MAYRSETRTFVDGVVSFLAIFAFVVGNATISPVGSGIAKKYYYIFFLDFDVRLSKVIFTCQMQSSAAFGAGSDTAEHSGLISGRQRLARSLCQAR